ncbi:MAG TPA: hypothetical protein IAA29_06580 [Candidatus Paenibacillus intestinavium]|nr:hypothetical protein [Candidatus Paenibacillus intestinavium]
MQPVDLIDKIRWHKGEMMLAEQIGDSFGAYLHEKDMLDAEAELISHEERMKRIDEHFEDTIYL